MPFGNPSGSVFGKRTTTMPTNSQYGGTLTSAKDMSKNFPGYGLTPSQLAAALGLPQQTSKGTYTPASTPSSNASYISSAGGAKTAGVQPSQGPVVETNGGQRLGTTTGAGGSYLPAASAFTAASTGGPQTQSTGAGGTTTNQLPSNGTDPTDWRFLNSDTSFSQRDLETLLNDPYAFQQEFLKAQGLGTPGANAALGQYASRLNPLAFALAGANMGPNAQSDLEDLANVYQGLLSNYITPGGRMPDVGEIMNTLLGTPDISNGGAANSLLQSVLAGQDPQGQTQAVNQILGASLAGMPGLFGTGWANMLDQAANSYLNSTMDAYNGPDATYLGYLRNQPFWNQLAGR